MKEFFAKLLKVLSLILGIALLLVGVGLLIGFVYEFPKHDSHLLTGLAFLTAFSFVVAVLLLRIGTLTELTCKPVRRIVLIAFGALLLITAAGLAVSLFLDPGREGPGFSIFFLCTFVLIPAAGGYFLFRMAGNMHENPADRQRSRVLLYRLGQVMMLFFVLAIAVYLPTAWRLAVVFLLAILFVRIHQGWSGRRFRTPMGVVSFAEVFDLVVQGTLYLAMQLFFILLTGGIGGGRGGSFRGGGSSGGGGASGKW